MAQLVHNPQRHIYPAHAKTLDCSIFSTCITINSNEPSSISLQLYYGSRQSLMLIHLPLSTGEADRQKLTNPIKVVWLLCWTDLPTLSAPRSGSDLRMFWKRLARSLGGVFQDRRKSSAYKRGLYFLAKACLK